jgi:hypothetical protein
MDEEHWLLVWNRYWRSFRSHSLWSALRNSRALAFDSKLIIVLSDNYLLTLSGTAFRWFLWFWFSSLASAGKIEPLLSWILTPIHEPKIHTQGCRRTAIGTLESWQLSQLRLLVTSLVADIPRRPAWYDASCCSLTSRSLEALSIIVNQTISLKFILKVLNIFRRLPPRSCQNILNKYSID